MKKTRKALIVIVTMLIIPLILIMGNSNNLMASTNDKLNFIIKTQNGKDQVTIEEFNDLATFFPPTSQNRVKLDVYVASLSGNNEKITTITMSVTTSDNLKLLSVNSGTIDEYVGYPEYGMVDIFDFASSNLNSGMVSGYLTNEFKDSRDEQNIESKYLEVGSTPIKIAEIEYNYKENPEMLGFEISALFSGSNDEDIAYFDGSMDVNYPKNQIKFTSLKIGNPQSGPDLSINPKVTYGSSNTNAYMSNVGNDYTFKKNSSTNFTYTDTQNMYLDLGTAPDTKVLVTKDGKTINDSSGRYKIDSLTSDTTYVVTVGEGSDTLSYNIIIKVDNPTEKAFLSSLTASNGSFSEAFKSETFNYNLTLPYNTNTTEFNYQAIASDLIVGVEGIKTSYVSGDKVEITVTTPHDSSITNIYTITIMFAVPSDNYDLNKIDITSNGITQTLRQGNLNYLVPVDAERFSFTVFAADENASVIIKRGSEVIINTSDIYINRSETIIFQIEIIAQNGSDRTTYELTVTKEKSSNNELSSIQIIDGGRTYTINALETQTYYLINSTGLFNIKPILQDSKARVVSIIRTNTGIDIQTMADLQNDHISIGEEFIIKVVAENGSVKDYRIIISKKSNEREITKYHVRNDSTDLAIFGEEGYPYEIVYNNESDKIYSLTLPYKATNRIELFIQTSDKSSIEISTRTPINLNINKITNNTLDLVHTFSATTNEKISFRIIVSAENGEQTVYLFEITREGANTEKRLDTFELDGMPVFNFNNNAVGGSYETLYIRPNTLTTNEYLLTLNLVPKSQESNVRVTINDENQGIEKGSRALSYKITSRGKLYSILIEVFSESSPDTNPAIYRTNVMFASDDVELLNIGLEGLQLNEPTITESGVSYFVETTFLVNQTKILFDVKTGSNLTYSSDARTNWNLNVGENKKVITVTSEDKRNTKTYEFVVEKLPGREEKYLDTLYLYSNGEFLYEFNIQRGNTEYKYRVDDIYQNITLKASIPDDIGATLSKDRKVYVQDYVESIASSTSKIITISVYDENGTEQPYFIEILRANNDSNFESVTIGNTTYNKSLFEDGNQNFGGVLKLDNVLYSKEYLDFFISGMDTKANIVYPTITKVIDGRWNLVENLNTLTFQIEAQDKSKSLEYRVEVFREPAKTNNQVFELMISYINQEGENVLKTFNNPELGKQFEEIVGKGVDNIVITVKLLKEHRSKIEGFNLLDTSDETYNVYQRTFTTSVINVNVTAENGDINTHVVNISKLNNNNIIENIEIIGIENDYTINFVGTYTLRVRHATEPFIIRITKEDAFAKLVINDTQIINQDEFYYEVLIDPSKLNEGSNSYQFKLQSEYNYTNKILQYGKTFTIVILKEEVKHDNYLSGLEVNLSESDPANYLDDFAVDKYRFNEIKLNSTQQRVIINAFTNKDDYSTVLINDIKVTSIIDDNNILWKSSVLLDSKEVNIKITVIAEDGISKNDYIIPINRKSDENTIQRVVVSINGKSETYIDFNNLINLGEVSHSTSKIQIEILRSDKFASVYVDGFLKSNQNVTSEYSFTYDLANPNENERNQISIHLVSEYGSKGHTVNFEITRKKADTNTKLSGLEILNNGTDLFSGATVFSPNINKYQFIIPTTSSNQIFVTANTESSLSKAVLKFGSVTLNDIEGENLTLESGLNAANIIEITVTSESGATFKYTIYIYYALNNTEINNFNIIDNEGLGNLIDINFNGTNTFTTNIDWDFGETSTFNLTLEDINASYEIIRLSDDQKLNPNNITLIEGLNRFQIIVKSNYGLVENANYKVDGLSSSTKVYNLNITKAKANRDTNLTDLKVINTKTGSTIAFDRSFDPFDSNNKVYNINLKNKVETIKIELSSKDHQEVIYELGNIDLTYDSYENISKVITIQVLAQGVEDKYIIRITKGEDLSNDTSINNLIELKGPNKTYVYDFNINNENNPLVLESTVNYIRLLRSTLVDPNGSFENDVIESIIPGQTSKLTFVVVAEDGITKQTYELFVLREGLSADNTLKTLTISANGIQYYTNDLDDVENEINVNIPRNQNIVMISTSVNDLKAAGLQINAKKINGFSVENEIVTVVSGRLNIITITVVAENGDIKVYRINVNLRDTDATIGLEFQLENNTKLIPEITKDEENNTIYYNLGVLNYNEKLLNIITNKNGNDFVVIDGYGSKQLNIGENEFIVTSTSEDQLTKITHIVTVERLDGDNSNKLLDLKVHVPSLNTYLTFEEGMFDENKNLYTINIVYEEIVRTVNVIASLKENSKATITGDGTYQLNEINGVLFAEINVVVTSEVGVSNTYVVQIVKGGPGDSNQSPEPISDDASIKDVFTIKGPNNEYNYSNNDNSKDNPLIINSNETYLRIIGAANDSKATLDNDLFDNVKPGLNEFEFRIVAESGMFEDYIIYVFKEDLSDDNTLKSLRVRYNGVNYYEKTNNDVEDEINITLPREALEITITAIKNDLNAKEPQISDYILETGKLNTITVTVIAENGDVKVYRININLRDTSAEILLDFELENKAKITADITNDLENKTIYYDLGEIAYSENILNIIENTGTNKFIQVTGSGLKQLKIGENEFVVTATSEDLATTITHVINITRLTGDEDNLLTSLEVFGNGELIPFDGIDFDPLTNNYIIRLSISSKLESVLINAAVDELSKAVIKGTGMLVLNNKDGMIFEQARIVVTSEVGIENIYTIEIIKASSVGSDDDNSVSEIYVKGLETNKKYPYIIGNNEPIVVDKADEFIEIVVKTNSNKAIVSGTLIYKLIAGQLLNARITVKSENLEASNDYIIPIIKHALNDDAVVSEIIIDGELVTIDSGAFKIKHLIDSSITQVLVELKLPDGARVNYDLPYIFDFNENTKEINFAVTSEDGLTTNIYTLELIKDNYEVKMESILIDDTEEINNFQDLILNLGNKAYQDAYFTINAASVDPDAKVVISLNGKTLSGIKELTFDVTLSVGQNIIEIYAESEFGKSDTYVIVAERSEPSDNNLLADLAVINPNNNLPFDINFAPNTKRYTIEIQDIDNLPSINIRTVKGETNQIIEGDGIHDLSFNGNSGLISETVKIKVIAESGLVNTYEVVITRNLKPETDISVNRLSLIGNNGINYLGTELSALEQFFSGNYEYNLVIPYAVEKLILTVVNNNGAEVSFTSGNGTYSLLGINVLRIEFYLTSKDSTENNIDTPYIINIVKEEPSDDNTLEFIEINNELIKDFNPNKTYYELIVDADLIKNISIDAIASNIYANISGTGIKQVFPHSDNFFTIRVTAENGEIKDYIINVKSQSNDNEIEDIKVRDYNITPIFDQSIYTYTLDVEYGVNTIEILAIANTSAKITNNGFVRLVEGINNIEVYATSESGIRGKIYTIKVNRLPISSDNTLKSLIVKDAISGLELPYQPVFNADMLGYVIVLDKLSPTISINIEAEANNKYATVGGLGFHNLENKLENTEFGNIFNITVRAQNGDTKTYQLKVYKGVSNLDSDIRINELSLIGSNNTIYLGTNEKANIKFNGNTYEYLINVAYDIKTLTLNLVPASNQATVYYLSSNIQTFNGQEELIFEFYVQAATGITSDTYQIVVKRAEPLSDNTLENIKIDNEFIEEFDPETKEYEIYIPYGSTNHKMNLTPIVQNGNKVSLQGEFGEINLKKGKNIFPIIVTSENGKQNTYTVVVYHYNNNAKLEELIITGDGENPTVYRIDFNPETYEYNIVISRSEKALMISARAEDKESGIYGATKRLLNGNGKESFDVTVVAEDGITTNIYRVNTSYNQELSNNKNIDVRFSNIPFEMFNGQLSYHLPLKDRLTSTQIHVTSEYEGTKIDINVNGKVVNNNQINLEDNNNLITLKVTAEDGSVEFYTINIEKEPVQDVTFIILLILTFVLWFITIIVVIIKKNKQKDPVFTDVIY